MKPGGHLSDETKAKLAASQKKLAAAGKHWTQSAKGRKHMADLARKRANAKPPHWTSTPAGRKRMAKIAAKGRATFAQKLASGELIPWQRTPEGRARMAQIGRKNGRPDITDKTRAKIAERVANGGVPEVIAREYRVSGNTVRAWAKAYGDPAARAKHASVPWGAHRSDISEATRHEIGRRVANGARPAAIASEYGISATTARTWAKLYRANRPGARPYPPLNGHRATAAKRVAPRGLVACGACRVCVLCLKFGVDPQWSLCLVANPDNEGGVK